VGVSLVVWIGVCGYVGDGREKFDLMTGNKINHKKREAYALSSKSNQNLTLKNL